MYWFHTRKQNAELRQTNVALTYENEWLFSYALDGDEQIGKLRAQVADPQAEQLAAALFESERELETMWRERDDARAQRDRLNEQCDTLTREAAEQIGELHRLLLEATLARDDYRARYEAAQEERTRTEAYIADVTGQREALREKLVAAQKQLLNGQPPPETQDAVKKAPRRPRGKEQVE